MPDRPVTHVSDTARWVAYYRAMESERPDAIFRDPFARRLAGPKGEEIVRKLHKGRQTAWPMIVRTAVMDEVILRAVGRDDVEVVMNLAAGLDTRPYRLELPASLTWYDVDLPDVLTYKQRELANATANCRLESVPVDLTDHGARRALFARVAADEQRVLVVSEGLLVYLDPKQVGELASDLAANAAMRWWLIDIAAPKLIKMLEKRWGDDLRAGNAPFKFAPEEGTAFFAPYGWREAEFRSIYEEAHRLKRTMPLAWLWRTIGKVMPARKQEEFKRMSAVVLLEATAGALSRDA